MSGYQTFTDSQLVTLLRDGDHLAYTQIYERYYYLMFSFSFKKLRDKDLAKDFVQDLFTKLWFKRETILENGNLSQFLYISLKTSMLNFFAHEKVEAKYIEVLKGLASEPKTDYADNKIRERQLAEYIEMQIQNLPKKMKEIFMLSRKEHFTNKEIASKLDTTESNVSHQISNAVKILKAKLNILLLF
ncbi:RNA polymerase sigma-70 factor [Pedobacter sp. KBW01]|uniref:sigma-70 family RNA polymerase sigma factor n=1 Tax=Pedobacter sp. KBW01 TaxID=2153364 RepID=UPI000F597710|nr:sigma-70 family RNA polymerase sigma factor [Pedobacter sp. KBW01]RQO79081.1 RNA polymerase sigma-70 factor [Pedobacter sp. KBW01]